MVLTKKFPENYRVSQKMVIMSGFEYLALAGVFLGVKNNSKNFLFYKTFKVL